MSLGGLIGTYVGLRLFSGLVRVKREAEAVIARRAHRNLSVRPKVSPESKTEPCGYGGRIVVRHGRLRLVDAVGELVNPGRRQGKTAKGTTK